ncbi:MAG: hypothetical protein JW836_17530 [Deltaproteobacteria bacterium]|nr:hypothetical protein [Deltaproteobacteria bacterium]
MAINPRIDALRFRIFELLTALSIVMLFSCAQYPDILGKWKESGKPSSLEFRQDGTFRAVDDMGMVVVGKYTLKTNGRIRLEIQHQDASTEIITGTLFGRENELILAFDGDKEAMRYKRAKD